MSTILCPDVRRLRLVAVISLVICGYFCCVPIFSQAPHLRFDTLDTDSGLSQETVHAIHQDHLGYMWFGTQDGLNRWDGIRFVAYRNDLNDPKSLSDNRVRAIAEDESGRIWVASDSGSIDRLTPETGEFDRFATRSSNPVPPNLGEIRTMLWKNSQELWIGGSARLALVDTDSGEIRSFQSNGLSEIERIRGLVQNPDGSLWIGHSKGLSLLDASLERADPVPLPGDSKVEVWSLIRGPKGNLWLAVQNRVLELSPSGEVLQTFVFGQEHSSRLQVTSVLFDSGHRMWVTTTLGLYLSTSPDHDVFYSYRKNPASQHGLVDDELFTVFEDRTGIVWFGTLAGGVARWHPATLAFGRYPADPLEASSTYAFGGTPNGDIWIGTRGGDLLRWREGSAKLEAHPWVTDIADRPGAFKDARIMCLLGDSRGFLWIGTRRNGLIRFDTSTGRYSHFNHQSGRPGSLSAAAVMTIFESRAGEIFVGTVGGGLDRFDMESETFSAYESGPGLHQISSDRIPRITETDSQSLWLAGYNQGLDHLDLVTGRVSRFRHDPDDPNSLPADSVTTLHVDSQNQLWIGTLGSGFSRITDLDLAEANARFQSWNESHGLANNTINGILSDPEGRIWLSTNRGISRFDPKAEKFTNFEPRHGIQSWEFNLGAYFKSTQGDLFFGGSKGFNRIRPGDLETLSKPPPVALTSLTINNRPVPLSLGLANASPIQLTHRDTSLGFGVAALDFWDPGANRYTYKLDGFDRDWLELKSKGPVSYTNLDPGKYVFRAKASNSEGVWNERGLAIPVWVSPAPWETWWAWSLYAAFAIGFIYSGVRWRLSALERRSEELKELVELRTGELKDTVLQLQQSEGSALDAKRRALKSLEEALEERRKAQEADQAKSVFLSNMSHELRTPLNAVLGFAQLMERDPQLTADHQESLKTILRSGEHLLNLINDVLSLAKIEAGRLTLSKEPFRLRRTCRDVEDMVRPRAVEKSLTLELAIAEDVPRAVEGDRGRLIQVLLNLMGNAVKFTDKGTVGLHVSMKGTLIDFAVSDTGVGIPAQELPELFEPFHQTEVGRAEQEGTGLGLAISERLVELMKGTLRLESELGKGTTFAFSLPLPPVAVEEAPDETRQVVAIGLGHKPPKILVADDAEANRNLLRRLFEDVGLPVQTASDGAEAVAIWEQWRPSLIWMDMRMPEMDGYEATRTIRQAEAEVVTGRTTILALTAAAFEDDRRDILAAGCDDVVTKPYRERVLFEKMTEHLDLPFVYGEVVKPGHSAELPKAQNRASKQDSEDTQASSPLLQTQGSRILVAEDNLSNQVVARRMLERLGFEADVVPNGSLVLEAFSTHTYSLVLMDIRMPKMDGVEATKQLRAQLPADAQPSIIALTGMASEDERQMCLRAGMDDLLAKPFRIEELQNMVERWLPRPGAPSHHRQPTALPEPPMTVDKRTDSPPLSTGLPLDRQKLRLLHQLDDGSGSQSLAAQVISLFLDTVPGQLKELQRAIHEGSLGHWRRVAHSLKNSSSTLGADAVSSTCLELEQLGRSSQDPEILRQKAEVLLEHLSEEIEQALAALSVEQTEAAKHRDSERSASSRSDTAGPTVH